MQKLVNWWNCHGAESVAKLFLTIILLAFGAAALAGAVAAWKYALAV